MFPFFCYYCVFFFSLALSLSRPCLPARAVPKTVTVSTTETQNATWHNFTRLLHAERGSELIGMSELKKYFHRFGYLPSTNTTLNFTNIFDAQLEDAVVLYQKRLGLPITGKLDSDTMSTIMAPRCGISDDTPHKIHAIGHYSYFEGQPRWARNSPTTLTYAFSPDNMIDELSKSEIQIVFKRAFSRWSFVIPVNFREIEEYESADIRIGFYLRDHGDGEPFDGPLGILAHAFAPENGRFHLDAAESWAVDFDRDKSKRAVDLESVATHEIGHVLGLAHSLVKEAVMYPSLRPRTKKVDLTIDDVEGVQALYGSNPNFTLSSLLESENSSNLAVGLESRLSIWTLSLGLSLLMFFLCT